MYLKLFSTFLLLLLLAIAVFVFQAQWGIQPSEDTNHYAEIASRFLLTDLCLSTESRHTRHLSQPELIAPFQDTPGYLDHFPSSTFIGASNLKSSFVQADSIVIKNVRHP